MIFLSLLKRYQDFEATASASPTKDYLPLGSLLGPSPYRGKDTGSYDDEDYYSESDEIVYCSEENLDIVNRTIKVFVISITPHCFFLISNF
jgi:hypothetical protein